MSATPNMKTGRSLARTRRRNDKRTDSGLPHFETYVNPTAGLAAKGIRVGFPAERTVDLSYCDYISLAGPIGTIGKQVYNLTSAYDPDYSGTGHQPMGFDQWALFYNHYVVESCAYEVQAVTGNGPPVHVWTHLSDDNVTPSDLSEFMELGAAVGWVNAYVPGHTFRGKVDTAKFFNRTAIASDDQLRSAINASPAEGAYLTVCCQNVDLASDVTTYWHVKLIYRVRFMEPKDLGPSAVVAKIPRALFPVPDPTEFPCPEGYQMVPKGK